MATYLLRFFRGIICFFNRLLRKSFNHHVSKTCKANNASKNGPVTKYHITFLHRFLPIINLGPIRGQQFDAGFSLIEVMIVASLMAFLGVLGLNLRDSTQRSQNILEGKFSSLQLKQEIESILANSQNCRETFQGIEIRKFEAEKEGYQEDLPLTSLIQIIKASDPSNEDIKRDVFKLNEPLDYTGTKIEKYKLKRDSLSFIQFGFTRATLTLVTNFSFKVSDSPIHQKGIRLNFTVDPDNLEIQDCSVASGGTTSGSGGSFTILDSIEDKSLEGQTGDAACESLGMKCSHVQSLNFAAEVFGQDSLANLCQINYNSSANEIKKGTIKTNIHSCEAKLGIYETYVLKTKSSGVTCKGIFTAICR